MKWNNHEEKIDFKVKYVVDKHFVKWNNHEKKIETLHIPEKTQGLVNTLFFADSWRLMKSLHLWNAVILM